MGKFVVFGLPRCRTKWLSVFLAPGPWTCGHDISVECNTIQEWEDRFSTLSGTVETAGFWGWRVIKKRMPWVRMAVVKRPIEEIQQSFMKYGVLVPLEDLEERAAALEELIAEVKPPVFTFEDLTDWRKASDLYAFCLDEPCSRDWYHNIAARNIQVNVIERLTYLQWNWGRIQQFKDEVLAEAKLYDRRS